MSSTSQTLQPEDLLEHLEWMRRLARALTNGDAAEAEDLTEDAVQAALADPPRLQGPVRPWLAGVLRNLARMRGRTSARRRRRDAATLVVDGMGSSPAELAERVEAQRLVASLVLGLAEPFRSTMVLRYYEDLSAAEVARRLGVPAGTVRWRIKHALDELRLALDRAYAERREKWHALLLPLPMPAPAKTARPARGPRVPTGASAATRMTVAGQTVIAAVCLLLLAIGAAGVVGLVHHARRRAAALAEAAARRPAGGVSQLGPRGASLLAAPPNPAGAPAAGLRLEGQVIDAQDDPVGGATVGINSNPPRTAITRPDGGFVFEGLMPRSYRLEASSGPLYSGVSVTWLSPKSEPIVLRAKAGQEARILVRAASDGHPIASAHVTVRLILSWEKRTGPDGAVAFTGLAWDTPPVRVEAAGFATFQGGLVSMGETPWEIRLEPGTPVEGRVIDAHGAAVVGALVWASPASQLVAADDPQRDSVTTDAAGRWRTTALAAGTYRFEASHQGYAQGETAPTHVDGFRPREPIDIRLEDGGSLTGEVRDSDGIPLASVQVRAAEKVTYGRRFPREAFSDASGRFSVQGLPRRMVDVVAIGGDASSPTVAVNLGMGGPERHIVLVMSNDRSIAGTVVDRGGQPVGEAQVFADPDPESTAWPPGEAQLRSELRMVADGGGRFRFAGLPAGDYRLRAEATAGTDMRSPSEGVSAKPGDRDVRIVVPGRGSVKGTVSFEDGGVPRRFLVTVGMVTRAFWDSNGGSFAFDVPAGHGALVVSGVGFPDTRVPGVDVAEGKTTDVGVVKVKGGRNVSGRIRRADGTPVAGADVAAGPFLAGDGREVSVGPDIPHLYETQSGDDGRYSMRVEDSELVLVAESRGGGRSRAVPVPRGPINRDIDLIIGATSALNGVVSRAGQPLPGAPVVATPRGTPTARFAVMSGPDGRYDFDVLAPGPYRVQVEDGAGTVKARGFFSNSVSVEEGRPARLDIDIPVGPHTVTVDVKTEQGDAIRGAKIVALSGGGAEMSSLKGLFERFAESPDGPASLRPGEDQPAGNSMVIADLLPGSYTICTTPSWIPPGRQETEQDPVRCIVQRVDSSRNVSLVIPAGWVRP